MTEYVHLYHAYDRPYLLEELCTGMALCGEKAVVHRRLTCKLTYVTCPHCRERAAKLDVVLLSEPVG
jgi:hypothetical protein